MFGLPIRDVPTLISRDEAALRVALLDEEYHEYRRAVNKEDLVGIADALADIIYIALGTALCYGLPMEEIWNAVQDSNMEKATSCEHCEASGCDEDGYQCEQCNGEGYHVLYREDGKVLKPEGWQPPNIELILYRAKEKLKANPNA
jgi:predicted HAD superfamily Cof-like phosphohydrolase